MAKKQAKCGDLWVYSPLLAYFLETLTAYVKFLQDPLWEGLNILHAEYLHILLQVYFNKG